MNMTPEQEKSYEFHKMLGWEYSHDEGDCVIVQLWRQDTMESRSLFAEVAISPDGGHKCVDTIQANVNVEGPAVTGTPTTQKPI